VTKLYFVCMGNYYRSRLAEELALHYAEIYGLEIETDSGGLAQIPNPHHPGPMAIETIDYLATKNIQPKTINRLPKVCAQVDIADADYVVFTDVDEQQDLFERRFPFCDCEFIGWDAHDKEFDPSLSTRELIDMKIEALIKKLVDN
jgi:protein-tyrosine phosphatase